MSNAASRHLFPVPRYISRTVFRHSSANGSDLSIYCGSFAATRLDGACTTLALGIDHPSHSDTDSVECNHRSREQAHVQDVGGGCDNCRNSKDNQYGVPQIPPHIPRAVISLIKARKNTRIGISKMSPSNNRLLH